MCQPGGKLPIVFSLDDLWMDGLMDGGCLSYPLLPSSSSQYPFLPSLWYSLHLWSSLCPLVIIMRRDQRLVTWWWDDIWTQSLTWRLIVISLYDSHRKLPGSRATCSLDICVNLYAIFGIRWLQHWPTISGAWVADLLFDEFNYTFYHHGYQWLRLWR